LASRNATQASLPGLGLCQVLTVPFEGPNSWLLFARAGSPFTPAERNLAWAMSWALATTRRERNALAALKERQTLLARLTRIQRSIAVRAPISDVLQAIVTGAAELLGERVVALRRIDQDQPTQAMIVCSTGLQTASALDAPIQIGEGAGGRAISEQQLVVIHDYYVAPNALHAFATRGLQAAMGAPVREDGAVIGSLVVASYTPGRRFSLAEQEALMAFADHASVAFTDARMVETLQQALLAARHDAMHDLLTGLPNRALLLDRLSQAAARSIRNQSTAALLFCDLDGLKHVNDSLGHETGDQLLVAVSARFALQLREADTVARLGGDEFAVLLEDLESVDEANEVTERLLASLSDPIVINGHTIHVSASIGIAMCTHEQTDTATLLREADLAMYEVKRGGGAGYLHYQPDMRPFSSGYYG
ncbi:MAG TPA: sensor domain-containing diguanylate cyclase, partial [Acidimicrobiales bacterium]|nr:sensor domain-containing diguanylate cyclase [Acidimicrobiales bacterium]